MAELTFGCCLTAAIIAWMQKGSGDSDTPSRSRNASLARSRSRITAVMSTSTAEVSWALTCSEVTMLSAIRRRVRVVLTTSSRTPEGSGAATWRPGGAAVAAVALRGGLCGHGSRRGHGSRLGRLGGRSLGAPRGRPGRRGRGLRGCAPRSRAAGADLHQLGPDRDRLVLADLDRPHEAGDGGGDLGVDLVGGDLVQGLVHLDAVAFLLEPAGDGALGDRLAKLRHAHRDRLAAIG